MFRRVVSLIILTAFLFTNFFTGTGYAQPALSLSNGLNLPVPGTMVLPTSAYIPVMMKGLQVHPDNPLLFDFILDTGKSGLKIDAPEFKNESQKLIKYFLASLTIKENDLWVNLSPTEKDRIIPDVLSKTELGRDMLAQDYILKQLTASLIYPEKEIGQKFWDKVYSEVKAKFGTSEIPTDTFNKVWIVADKAKVLERNNTAYVVGAHLKVLTENDCQASDWAQKHLPPDQITGVGKGRVGGDNTKILKEIIIPAIEKEVNEGAHFAQLRQMFYSMILATWYKQSLKNALLNQVYSNKDKTSGVLSSDPAVKEKIYAQYLESFKKGAYDYIKEEYDPVDQKVISRKYFSGGIVDGFGIDKAMQIAHERAPGDNVFKDGDMAMATVNMVKANPDAAMMSEKVTPKLSFSQIFADLMASNLYSSLKHDMKTPTKINITFSDSSVAVFTITWPNDKFALIPHNSDAKYLLENSQTPVAVSNIRIRYALPADAAYEDGMAFIKDFKDNHPEFVKGELARDRSVVRSRNVNYWAYQIILSTDATKADFAMNATAVSQVEYTITHGRKIIPSKIVLQTGEDRFVLMLHQYMMNEIKHFKDPKTLIYTVVKFPAGSERGYIMQSDNWLKVVIDDQGNIDKDQSRGGVVNEWFRSLQKWEENVSATTTKNTPQSDVISVGLDLDYMGLYSAFKVLDQQQAQQTLRVSYNGASLSIEKWLKNDSLSNAVSLAVLDAMNRTQDGRFNLLIQSTPTTIDVGIDDAAMMVDGFQFFILQKKYWLTDELMEKLKANIDDIVGAYHREGPNFLSLSYERILNLTRDVEVFKHDPFADSKNKYLAPNPDIVPFWAAWKMEKWSDKVAQRVNEVLGWAVQDNLLHKDDLWIARAYIDGVLEAENARQLFKDARANRNMGQMKDETIQWILDSMWVAVALNVRVFKYWKDDERFIKRIPDELRRRLIDTPTVADKFQVSPTKDLYTLGFSREDFHAMWQGGIVDRSPYAAYSSSSYWGRWNNRFETGQMIEHIFDTQLFSYGDYQRSVKTGQQILPLPFILAGSEEIFTVAVGEKYPLGKDYFLHVERRDDLKAVISVTYETQGSVVPIRRPVLLGAYDYIIDYDKNFGTMQVLTVTQDRVTFKKTDAAMNVQMDADDQKRVEALKLDADAQAVLAKLGTAGIDPKWVLLLTQEFLGQSIYAQSLLTVIADHESLYLNENFKKHGEVVYAVDFERKPVKPDQIALSCFYIIDMSRDGMERIDLSPSNFLKLLGDAFSKKPEIVKNFFLYGFAAGKQRFYPRMEGFSFPVSSAAAMEYFNLVLAGNRLIKIQSFKHDNTWGLLVNGQILENVILDSGDVIASGRGLILFTQKKNTAEPVVIMKVEGDNLVKIPKDIVTTFIEGQAMVPDSVYYDSFMASDKLWGIFYMVPNPRGASLNSELKEMTFNLERIAPDAAMQVSEADLAKEKVRLLGVLTKPETNSDADIALAIRSWADFGGLTDIEKQQRTFLFAAIILQDNYGPWAKFAALESIRLEGFNEDDISGTRKGIWKRIQLAINFASENNNEAVKTAAIAAAERLQYLTQEVPLFKDSDILNNLLKKARESGNVFRHDFTVSSGAERSVVKQLFINNELKVKYQVKSSTGKIFFVTFEKKYSLGKFLGFEVMCSDEWTVSKSPALGKEIKLSSVSSDEKIIIEVPEFDNVMGSFFFYSGTGSVSYVFDRVDKAMVDTAAVKGNDLAMQASAENHQDDENSFTVDGTKEVHRFPFSGNQQVAKYMVTPNFDTPYEGKSFFITIKRLYDPTDENRFIGFEVTSDERTVNDVSYEHGLFDVLSESGKGIEIVIRRPVTAAGRFTFFGAETDSNFFFERVDEADKAIVNGGIELNGNKMGLDVIKNGSPSTRPDGLAQDEPFRFNPAMVAEFQKGNLLGVEGIILRIISIPSPLPMLGLE
ncbi:MAG: hypothetical protein HQL25_04140 [Candidatus Omnitrophica bacterium]|nr:hypothetical protein [Candidatus Omnitrophota bacterium]